MLVRTRALDSGPLPPNLGSLLRGVFGAALKEVSCTRSCRGDCAYHYLFETKQRPDAPALRAADHVPHPFVLRPPELPRPTLSRDDPFDFEIVLVGRAHRRLDDVLAAFERMADLGLGRERVRLRVIGVLQLRRDGVGVIHDGSERVGSPALEQLLVDEEIRPAEEVSLQLVTPTHIVSSGRRLDTDLPFQPLARALLRRMSSLALFHCDRALDVDYRCLVERATGIKTRSSDLRPSHRRRYSARQRAEHGQSGLTGTVSYEGTGLSEFLPLLLLGEQLHVGKGTAFGMGRYLLAS